MPFLETPVGRLWVRDFPGRPPPLVALHGFSLHGGSFGALAAHLDRRLLAPDLPGHGETGIPATVAKAVAAVASLLASSAPPLDLLGYSQGGRIALQLALEHPELVRRLILVSTSPGLAEVSARAERRRRDERWADLLDDQGLEVFLERWLALPLFEGLRDPQLDMRRENDPRHLAEALRGMSVSVQRYLGHRLGELEVPVLLVVGERDRRYREMAGRMAEAIPRSRLEVIPGAGHALVADAPREVAAVIVGWD